jgi:antitoxin component YwqK of YwqJK toxin-antitoxin module
MTFLRGLRVSYRLIAAFAVVSAVAPLLASLASAQEPAPAAADNAAAATKEVYLDEPTPAPEPTVAQQGPVSEKYDDGKVRVERNVRLLSDNQIVNHGKYTEYYRNGQKFAEGNFDGGVHDGPWSYWHENGQLAKTVTYKKGAPDGAWEIHRADGTLQSKKGYQAGKRDGAWVVYYDDGKTPKIEQAFLDGKLSGPRKTFYASGKPHQEANFSDGMLDGKMTEWDEAGRKLAEATFEKGMLNGTLVRWGADGSTSEQNYRENKLIPPGTNGEEPAAVTPKAQEQPRLINSGQ